MGPVMAGHVILMAQVSTQPNLGDENRPLIVTEKLRRYVAGQTMISVVGPGKGYWRARAVRHEVTILRQCVDLDLTI